MQRDDDDIERTDPNLKVFASAEAYPEPPALRRACGITTHMDFNYFAALLQSETVGAVVDVRDQTHFGFDSPRSLHALMEGMGIQYFHAAQRGTNHGYRFAPLLTTSRELERAYHDKHSKELKGERTPFAWTEYLEGLVALYKERRILTQGGFLHGLVYGPHESIAFLCDCAHHKDCHRQVLLGILATRIPGIEVKHLEPEALVPSEPPLPRRPPTRYVVRPVADAGIETDGFEADGSVVSLEGTVLSRHVRPDGYLDIAVSAELDGDERPFVLRQAPDLPIHPPSFGLNEAVVRDFIKPGHRIRYGVERLHAEQGVLRLDKGRQVALSRQPASPGDMRHLARALSQGAVSIRDAFPGLERERNRAFLPRGASAPTATVIRCKQVIVRGKDEFMVTDASEPPWVFVCENRDFRLSHYIRQGAVAIGNEYQNLYGLFALADPDEAGRRRVVLSHLFFD